MGWDARRVMAKQRLRSTMSTREGRYGDSEWGGIGPGVVRPPREYWPMGRR